MLEIERAILEKMMGHHNGNLDDDTLSDLINQLEQRPFASYTFEFINHPLVQQYFEKLFYGNLWVLVANYVIATTNRDDKLAAIEALLFEKTPPNDKEWIKEGEVMPMGTKILPRSITYPCLIRNVYLSGDEPLIALFKYFLPTPPLALFEGYAMSAAIAAKYIASQQSVLSFLERNSLETTKKPIIAIQRAVRSRNRKKEEVVRINAILTSNYQRDPQLFSENVTLTAQKLMEDANTPYVPQACSPALANRIFSAAKQVKLFSTVRHLTYKRGLTNIFNDALYAQRTLINSYTDFTPAVLRACDVKNGDGNAICFGPHEIHASVQDVELVFDSTKIMQDNPAVFYKQFDFGYQLESLINKVMLGGEPLFFTYTRKAGPRASNGDSSFLRLCSNEFGKTYAVSELKCWLFIASNPKDMHQILTLNFFRFLDTIGRYTQGDKVVFEQKIADEIYSKIALLDDAALLVFLEDLGKQMTAIAEFNIFGAHQIDFRTLVSINFCAEPRSPERKIAYKLVVAEFVSQLQQGDLTALREAHRYLPEIFKSYRWVDYLLSAITHPNIRPCLEQLRKQCSVPFWVNNGFFGALEATRIECLEQGNEEKRGTLRTASQ